MAGTSPSARGMLALCVRSVHLLRERCTAYDLVLAAAESSDIGILGKIV